MAVEATSEQREVFEPLEDSPYRVDGTSRRERRWFSDGVWLDQGQTGEVVGFVWTHWLADRGVQQAGIRLDESFARALYRAAREEAGQGEDDGGGAFVWAAARVLEARQLIQATYACGTIESVTTALLERGPVVAGLTWASSMTTPEEVGGRAVVRAEPNATALGGHAILLNGIDLDLELDGVRGFVRFKNSWGRNWGDAGHAWISLADLERSLQPPALLPIPARATLGPDEQQDVAATWVGPDVVRYEQEGIGSDLWTVRDTVGYGAYADAIARGIQHPETQPPLTIGIKAPWGAGKTSLMRMIRERLEWPLRSEAPEASELRPLKLASPTIALRASLTYRFVLDRLQPDAKEARISASPVSELTEPEAVEQDELRWRPTVWFNPWMFQTGEQVWAGLAHAIIEQTTSRMSVAEREQFWLELNLRRIDEQAVRRKVYSLVFERILPAALGIVAVFVAGLVLLAVGSLEWVGTALAGSSPLALGALVAAQRRSVLGKKVGGGLAELAGTEGTAALFSREQFAGTLDTLVRAPDYVGRSGFLYLVQTDMERVLSLVAKPTRPLVIFVDDLDRCSPSTVVQVIEAINLFLAGEFKNTIFILAMEPEMVAAHIEAAYKELVDRIRERGRTNGDAVDLGWRFLEKFVQLPLALPGIEPERTKTFFESLFPTDGAPGGEGGQETVADEPASEADIKAVERQLDAESSSLGEAIGGTGAPEVLATEAGREALRRVVARRLSRDNEEIQRIVAFAARHLDPPNPREIKRFVNVFRFLVMIHTERTIAGQATAASLDQVAKIALVSTRWPSLVSAFAEESSRGSGETVFELLEQPPETTARRGEAKAKALVRGLKQALEESGLSESDVERLLSSDVRGLMASEPVVGSSARSYL